MQGFDGTLPLGQGPMTGRGRVYREHPLVRKLTILKMFGRR